MAWTTFYQANDIASTLEVQYNPTTKQFKEIKTFDDPSYGTTERVFVPDELPYDQMVNFGEVFPNEELP